MLDQGEGAWQCLWLVSGHQIQRTESPQLPSDFDKLLSFVLPKPKRVFSGDSGVKNLPASAGDERDVGSVPGLRRSPGGRKWQSTPVFLPGKILWTGEPGGLQSIGLQRVGHT